MQRDLGKSLPPRRRSGVWWKYADYCIDDGAIVPLSTLKVSRFDPWNTYAQERVQHGILSPPYVRALSLAERLKHYPPRAVLVPPCRLPKKGQDCDDTEEGCVGTRSKWELPPEVLNDVLDFCRTYGLLGVERLRSASKALTELLKRSQGLDDLGYSLNNNWSRDKPSLRVADLTLRSEVGAFPDPKRLSSAYSFEPRVYWEHYGEDIDDFCRDLWEFYSIFDEAVESSHSDSVNPSSCRYFHSLVAVTETRRGCDEQGLYEKIVPPSLLCHFAMMFLNDLSLSRRFIRCETCSQWFVAEDQRAKYCSARCRRTMMMRNYRATQREVAPK
jgi:hypothetical protein